MSTFGALMASEPGLVRPIKRSEYHQMISLDLFRNERVELIRGVLVKMSPQHAPHASTIQKLTRLPIERLGDRFAVRVQLPLALSDDTEPEPDLAIVAPGEYEAEHPTTAELVIEVSDTTLRKDRSKAEIYADAGVSEYWIVNLAERSIEVLSARQGDRYTASRELRAGEVLRPAALPDLELAVDEILPRG